MTNRLIRGTESWLLINIQQTFSPSAVKQKVYPMSTPKQGAPAKRKMGRPATGRDPVIAGRVPADIIGALDAWAKAHGKTRIGSDGSIDRIRLEAAAEGVILRSRSRTNGVRFLTSPGSLHRYPLSPGPKRCPSTCGTPGRGDRSALVPKTRGPVALFHTSGAEADQAFIFERRTSSLLTVVGYHCRPLRRVGTRRRFSSLATAL
jgi:hypothetical protein